MPEPMILDLTSVQNCLHNGLLKVERGHDLSRGPNLSPEYGDHLTAAVLPVVLRQMLCAILKRGTPTDFLW